MNKKIFMKSVLAVALASATVGATACSSKSASAEDSAKADSMAQDGPKARGGKGGGPQLGQVPNGGPVIDKSGDATLQAMIKEVLPQFEQLEYKDATTGKTIKYNLFTPKDKAAGKKYPVVLFIADASTPGSDVTLPLTQGYGGLVWATADWQKDHPCYVLVPQFSGVAVNDDYDHTDEVDAVARLVQDFSKRADVDTNRLYTTGQSMGGMISMYYNVQYPDLFAASIFVDSHWNTSTFPELAKHKFTYFIAGNQGHAYAQIEPLEKAADADGVKYAFAEWSARLPESEQSKLANEMFAKDAPVNMIEFSPKSVLPADGMGSEHMYSFDYAYKVKAVREWMFHQAK